MFRGASLWTGLIAGGLYQFQDTRAYRNGELSREEYTSHTTSNVSSTVGIMAGVEYGAMLGTAVLPGVGTVVGSVLGAIAGDRLGQYVGGRAGQWVSRRTDMPADVTDAMTPPSRGVAEHPLH